MKLEDPRTDPLKSLDRCVKYARARIGPDLRARDMEDVASEMYAEWLRLYDEKDGELSMWFLFQKASRDTMAKQIEVKNVINIAGDATKTADGRERFWELIADEKEVKTHSLELQVWLKNVMDEGLPLFMEELGAAIDIIDRGDKVHMAAIAKELGISKQALAQSVRRKRERDKAMELWVGREDGGG